MDKSTPFDLEERTEVFAVNVRKFIRLLRKDIANFEDSKQLVRSSGSVAANYIEANESLSRKDYIYRVKISRKEVKESRLWLNLIHCEEELLVMKTDLIQECNELMKIFGRIITNSQKLA